MTNQNYLKVCFWVVMTNNCITLCCLAHLTFADRTWRSTVLQMDSNLISIEKQKCYCSSKNTPFKVKKNIHAIRTKLIGQINWSREFNSQNITEKQTENPDYINTLANIILQSKKSNSRIWEVIDQFRNSTISYFPYYPAVNEKMLLCT